MNLTSLLLCLFLLSCSSLEKPVPNWKTVGSRTMIWSKNLDGEFQSGIHDLSFNSPTIEEDVLFLPQRNGNFTAFDLQTGKTIWNVKDDMVLGGRPAVYKDTVIYGSYDGRIFSRDKSSGKVIWSIDLGAPMESTPVIEGDRAFFHLRNHTLTVLDVITGKVLWSYRRSVTQLTTLQKVSRPIIREGKVFVGSADGYLLAFSLDEGTLAWEVKLSTATKFNDVDVEAFYDDGKIYVGSAADTMKVVSAKDGTIIQNYNFSIGHGVIQIDNRLFVGTMKGEVKVIFHGEEVGSLKLSKKGVSEMVAWKQQLVVATMDGKVHFIHPIGLKLLGSVDLGTSESGIFGEFSVSGDYLAFLSSRNRLYVYR